ncbi:olfactory receptor 7A10, partial [Tupaia chinensis]|uniref:olfactory receptor 7A10 n=1 Tax=Tupaia chinensis TaxID=246437 RepID=UPI000FFB2AC5
QTQSKVITYAGCITQMFFYILFIVLEGFLLTVMAYDRYVAICHPLHYTIIMNSQFCVLLVLGSWITCVLQSLLQNSMVLQLSFCPHTQIPHFFCEFIQVLHLACSDTFINDIVIYFAAVLLGSATLTGILYSYCKIVSSIRKISSAQGKYKAFSTCASHLSVVSLFYCSFQGVYLSAVDNQNSHSSAAASVMYIVVTPMKSYSLDSEMLTIELLFREYAAFSWLEHGCRFCSLKSDYGTNAALCPFVLLGTELQSSLFRLLQSNVDA